MTAKHKKQKKKIARLGFIKIKNFGATNNTIKKVKKQFREWEKNTCKPYI